MTLDTAQAAEYLHCSESRVQELAACGAIRSCRIGRGYVFRLAWLEVFLEREADRQQAQHKVMPTPARRRKLPDLTKY